MTAESNRNAGSLDPDFGSEGKAFPTNPSDPNGFVHGLTIASGKLLIAARFGWNYAIIRLNTDGSPDEHFGNSGVVTGVFERGYYSRATNISVYEDGRILLTGIFEETETSPSLPALARFHQDGRPDTSFGIDGNLVIRLPLSQATLAPRPLAATGRGTSDGATSTVLADGKIILTGNHQYSFTEKVGLLIRLEENGSLDTSFNDGKGFIIVRHPEYSTQIETKLIQPDGRIVVAGSAYVDDRAVGLYARYLPDGAIDDSFGSSGFAINTAVQKPTQILWITLQSNGKIIGVGSTLDFPLQGLLQCLNTDGSNDPSFNEGSPMLTTVDENPYGFEWKSAATQTDGNIIALGNTLGGEEADIILGRYLSNGKLDINFGDKGIVRTKVGTSVDVSSAVDVQENGRIVVAGYFFSLNGSRPVVLRYLN